MQVLKNKLPDIILALLLTMCSLATAEAALQGSGTASDPYLIQTAEDLKDISLRTAQDEYLPYDNYGTDLPADRLFGTQFFCKQTADIDLTGIDYKPIGYSPGYGAKAHICYDGNGHKIKNMTIDQDRLYWTETADGYSWKTADREGVPGNFSPYQPLEPVGFIAVLVESGSGMARSYVKNLTIENISVKSSNLNTTTDYILVGGIAGKMEDKTLIENCKVTGVFRVEGNCHIVGGICGLRGEPGDAREDYACTLTKCRNEAKITADNEEASLSQVGKVVDTGIGGIIGNSGESSYTTSIIQCSNRGDISGYEYCGGIVGSMSATIKECSNGGRIRAKRGNCGGIIGYDMQGGRVVKCLNTGTVEQDPAGARDVIDPSEMLCTGGIGGKVAATNRKASEYKFISNMNSGYVRGRISVGGLFGQCDISNYNSLNVGYINTKNSSYYGSIVGSTSYLIDPATDTPANVQQYYKGGNYADTIMTRLGKGEDPLEGKPVYRVAGDVFKPTDNPELYQMSTDSLLKNGLSGMKDMSDETTRNEEQYYTLYNSLEPWDKSQKGVYPVPNTTDISINVLASAIIELDTADRPEDVNHQFRVKFGPLFEKSKLRITTASGGKRARAMSNNVALYGLGEDTINITYDGMTRQLPVVVKAIDTFKFSGGKGTEDNPYILAEKKDLDELNWVINNYYYQDTVKTKNWSYDVWLRVENDLCEYDDPYTAIIGKDTSAARSFQGHLVGDGHKISIDLNESGAAALFLSAHEPASFSNLEINGKVEATASGAGLVCYAKGAKIDSCLNMANITASDTAGGLVAIGANCSFEQSGNGGLVYSGKLSGGLVGYNDHGKLNNCYNNGTVSTAQDGGGIAGSVPGGEISNSLNAGYCGRHGSKPVGDQNYGPIVKDTKELAKNDNNIWNIEANTVWDKAWENQARDGGHGVTGSELTDPGIVDTKLTPAWKTVNGRYPLPKPLTRMKAADIVAMPVTFSDYSTMLDAYGTTTFHKEMLDKPAKFNAFDFENGMFTDNGNGEVTPKDLSIGSIKDKATVKYQDYHLVYYIYNTNGLFGQNNQYGTAAKKFTVRSDGDIEIIKSIIDDVSNQYAIDKHRNRTWHKHFELTKDLKTPTTIKSSIGSDQSELKGWQGYFDGAGHEVSMNTRSLKTGGMFKAINNGGRVANLVISGQVRGQGDVGAIAGVVADSSSIEGCINSATITAEGNTGGIAGRVTNGSSLKDVVNIGKLSGKGCTGGIAGVCDKGDIRRAINFNIATDSLAGDTTGGIVGKYTWGKKDSHLVYQCLNLAHRGQTRGKSGAIAGVVVGSATGNAGGMNKCYYNKQLTSARAIADRQDEATFYQGLTTKELTDAAFGGKLAEAPSEVDAWEISGKGYAQLKALKKIANTEKSGVSANATYIDESETYANVVHNFAIDPRGEDNATGAYKWCSIRDQVDPAYRNGKKGSAYRDGDSIKFVDKRWGKDTLLLINANRDITIYYPLVIESGLFSGGKGTKEDPYRLDTKEDFALLAEIVNDNTMSTDRTKNWSDDKYFELQGDITDPGEAITTVIGKTGDPADDNNTQFGGHFDGQGHTVLLDINVSGDEPAGLFGNISASATIDSVNVSGKVSGENNVAGVCGINSGRVSQSTSTAEVTGEYNVGGVCGNNTGVISQSDNAGKITAAANPAGGVCGNSGGIGSAIIGCTNIGKVEGQIAGGIVGKTDGTALAKNLNAGDISAMATLGGICGLAGGSDLKQNINTGRLYATSTSCMAGQIAGQDRNSSYTSNLADRQFATLTCGGKTKKAPDTDKREDLYTNKMTGQSLKGKLGDDMWVYDQGAYPRPNNSVVAMLATAAVELSNVLQNREDVNDAVGLTPNTPGSQGRPGVPGTPGTPAIPAKKLVWKAQEGKVSTTAPVGKLLGTGQETLTVKSGNIERDIVITITCITEYSTDTIRACGQYELNGDIYTETEDIVDYLVSSKGCDSIVGIRLIISQPSKDTNLDTMFVQDKAVVGGKTYTESQVVKLELKNQSGCDSVVYQPVDVLVAKEKTDTLAKGCDSTLYEGKWYYKTHKELQTTKDRKGRDSVKTTELIVVFDNTPDTVQLSGIDSLKLDNGLVVYNDTTVSQTKPNQNGCMHTTVSEIDIRKTSKVHKSWKHCGPGKVLGKIPVSESCIVTEDLTNQEGVDSTVYWHVTIGAPKDTIVVLSQCESIELFGKKYTESARVDKTFEPEGEQICDSTVHYVLNVLKPSYRHEYVSGCNEVDFRGQTFASDTTLFDTLPVPSKAGCDSIVANHINVYRPTEKTLHRYAQEVLKDFRGKDIVKDTTVTDTLVNSHGCDSLVYNVIHVIHTAYDTTTLFGCENYVYKNVTYTESTMLYDTEYEEHTDDVTGKKQQYTTRQTTIYIQIGNYELHVFYKDSCDHITFRGVRYEESQTITDKFKSVTGCDSVIQYVLRVHHDGVGEKNIDGCHVAEFEGKTYRHDTTFVVHTATRWGCDSTCTVNIRIHESYEVDYDTSACLSLVYKDTEYTSDTTVTEFYSSSTGCDSTVYTHIRVLKPSYNTVTITGEYDAYYNKKKYVRSTVLHDTLLNRWGCDSFLTVAIVVEKSLDFPLIINKYGYMLICNNNIASQKYKTFQWYRNGDRISGATRQYFSEDVGQKLNGCYQVRVTTEQGNEYFSELLCIKPERPLVLFPNPAEKGEVVTIDYDFSEEEKKELYYEVYNSHGKVVHVEKPAGYPIEIPGMMQAGYYFVLIHTDNEHNVGCKFIVK